MDKRDQPARTGPCLPSVLVTGGCGFIGLNLVHHLLSRGLCDRVVVLDNLSVGTLEDLEMVLSEIGEWEIQEGGMMSGPGAAPAADRTYRLVRHAGSAPLPEGRSTPTVAFFRLDIRDPRGLDALVAPCSAVVHLAAQTGVIPSLEDPVYDMEQNVRGTLNLLEACRRAWLAPGAANAATATATIATPAPAPGHRAPRRFVFASSSAPLGEQDPPIDERKVPRPLSPYGASKLAGEGYCSAYAGSFGLETIALRFSNVYGPRSTYKNSVVAKFIKNILAGEPLTIYGTGGQTRDFIYTADLCTAIERALVTSDPRAPGSVFQIATFRETTVNELAEKLKAIAERAGFGPVEIRYAAERAGEIRRSFSDISRARAVLGYEPAYDLDAGLEATWQWFLCRSSGPAEKTRPIISGAGSTLLDATSPKWHRRLTR